MEKITNGHPLSQSADIVKENIDTLKSLFPTIVKEGKIDIEELKALLDEEIETNDEYYRFTWAGKNEARKEANKPTTATLRPCKIESKSWDTTENIIIEGDNLEVLKLLQKSYAGKIMMMYFDPPYNTGNDFVYKDNYADNLGNYLALTGQTNEVGNKLNTNTESDGRYHSNWLNMMYPRLKIAQNLLKDEGMIFISIDDHEIHNLRALCNEIFGEINFVDQLIWKKKYGGGAKTKYYVGLHEYILCYCKNKSLILNIETSYETSIIEKYYKYTDDKFDIRGPYRLQPLATNSMDDRPNLKYPIMFEGKEVYPEKQWQWSKERTDKAIENNEIVFSESNKGISVNFKQYLKDEDGEERTSKPFTIIDGIYTQHGTNEIKEIFGDGKIFDFPKPTALIKHISKPYLKDNDIVLDIFAGSGTTGHAILDLNKDFDGKLKFICIQLPEHLEIDSVAYQAGYKTISDICKERIRRVGSRIMEEKNAELEKLKQSIEGKILQDEIVEKIERLQHTISNLDVGFKVFKLDSSNINAWDGSVENFEQNLFNAENNIKDNRTEEDVLFEILLKYGLDLTVPITLKEVNSCKIYSVGGGVLFVCLSDNITTEIAESIGKWKEELQPAVCRALFKDNGFKDDVAKTNSIQILKQYGIEETNSI